jgi:UDP-glucose:(heptosyl)LPS alpha-1,3-glucosyltransferase
MVRRAWAATGGAERYLLRFAAGLAARGHDPMLVTGPDWPRERWPHGEIFRLQANSPRAFADALARNRAAIGCEQLFSLERAHACDTYRAGDGVHAAWLARRAAREPKWKSAFRLWQPKHREVLALEKELFGGGADRIIVNSKMVAREIREHFGTPEERIHLVYNGYDLPAHESTEEPGHGREATRQLLGIREDQLMILFTGSGWERKGLADAVAALDRLDNKSTILVVAGSGKMRPQLKHSRARYPGPILDMAPLYAAADLFVLPTFYDPFSNASLEAARHGLPVVTTTANGFGELIRPEVNGSVVPPGDVDRLAAALEYWCGGFVAREARAFCAEQVAARTVAANVAETLAVVER